MDIDIFKCRYGCSEIFLKLQSCEAGASKKLALAHAKSRRQGTMKHPNRKNLKAKYSG